MKLKYSFKVLAFIILSNWKIGFTQNYHNYLERAYNKLDTKDYLEYEQKLMIYDSSKVIFIDSMNVRFSSKEDEYIRYETNRLANILTKYYFIEINTKDSNILCYKISGKQNLVNPIKQYLEKIREENMKLVLLESRDNKLNLGLKLDTIKKEVLSITVDTAKDIILDQSFYTRTKVNGQEQIVFCKIHYSEPIISKSMKLNTNQYFATQESNGSAELKFNKRFNNYTIIYR